MKKVLILTHGNLADGVKNNAELIWGTCNEVACINAFLEDVSPQDELEAYFGSLDPTDEVVVFTDYLAGSVTKMAAPYIAQRAVHIVAGFNMPMVLEVLSTLDDPEDITAEFFRKLVEVGKDSICYVNDVFKVGNVSEATLKKYIENQG